MERVIKVVSFKREKRRIVSVAVILGVFMALAAGALILTAPAQAQQPPVKKTTSSAWVKLCEEQKVKSKDPDAEVKKRTVCLTHHERFHPNTGQPLISAAIRQISDPKKETLMIMVPLGRLLRPGLFLRVDKEKALNLPYSYCTPVGCVAEIIAAPEIIASFKKGQKLAIGTIDVAGRQIGFMVPLTGFTGAYKGPPIDRKIYAKARKEMFMKIRARQIKLAKKAAAAAKQQNATGSAGQAAPNKTP